jgi:FAD/FMN-containing dehydrogenase/Fe-S oxidoreductase
MSAATNGKPSVLRTRQLPIANEVGASDLGAELARRIRGEVRFGDGSRALYATDSSNYRQVPIGVVVPRDVEDVLETVAVCGRFDVPILTRGTGTSLAGQTTNTAVIIDFSKYLSRILELDPANARARVEPGVILDHLRDRAEDFHLTFGPDPSTHSRCTLGGMIGNDSCGVHSVMAGRTSHNVESLDILTYDGARFTVGPTDDAEFQRIVQERGRRGDIYRQLRALTDRHGGAIRTGFPNIPRRVSGYNLPELLPENGFNIARALVGSEGTLAIVLGATVRLVPSPRCRVLVVLGFASVYEAADHVPQVLASGPIGLEGMDDVLVEAMKKQNLHPAGVRLLPPGGGWLIAEFGGDTPEQARQAARSLVARLGPGRGAITTKLVEDAREQRLIWAVRESGLGATARVPGEPDMWEGWEDAAVAPERLGAYLREFRALLDRYEYRAMLYGHFGQGCVHTRIPFDLTSDKGLVDFRTFVETAADLVVSHGGSLSGEHGDGQSRAELWPRMFGPELMRAFEEFKGIWDPRNRMNPGKLVHPNRLDANLRHGPRHSPALAATHFRFPNDHGSFAYATERCVGVGSCRRTDTGTMCPSYMVTREEAHSTRGRAHLLFEMLTGKLPYGWRNEAVHDALDLCLSCKGCRSECPVSVDIATYKSEFLSHYYEGRLRPRSAYAFGFVNRWARVAARMPGLVNALSRAPLSAGLMKRAAGIAPERALPTFAARTFRDEWRARKARNPDGPSVILWADTFNNHWQPEIPLAAADVLEDAGFRVIVPAQGLCCGRPLYDYGMLTRAKRHLHEVLNTLRAEIRAGIPVVGVEPSCMSVFRDELVNLLPDDVDAQALRRQSFMFDEFLASRAPQWQPPTMLRHAVVHGHCHQKSIMGIAGEVDLLARMGVDATVLDAGCCGMAGGFGYEKDHYDVSIACAERRLLPAVRAAADETLLVVDGFSCREQIRQITGREALHFAQVVQLARTR